MSVFYDLPWGLILVIPFIIAVFTGGGKKILKNFHISPQTFLLLIFLMIGGSLLSPWYLPGDLDIFINVGSLTVPLILFIVWFCKIGKKEKFRSLFAMLMIGSYYLLAKGGFLWKLEEYIPEIIYFFTPTVALIAYIFCGFNRAAFVALAGGIIIGESLVTIIIGSTIFQEIFGLEVINLLFLSLFYTAGFYYITRFYLMLFKHEKKLESLTNQEQS